MLLLQNILWNRLVYCIWHSFQQIAQLFATWPEPWFIVEKTLRWGKGSFLSLGCDLKVEKGSSSSWWCQQKSGNARVSERVAFRVIQAHVGGHTLQKSMPISLWNQISLRMLSTPSHLPSLPHRLAHNDDTFTRPHSAPICWLKHRREFSKKALSSTSWSVDQHSRVIRIKIKQMQEEGQKAQALQRRDWEWYKIKTAPLMSRVFSTALSALVWVGYGFPLHFLHGSPSKTSSG